jgi:hypothetical protein
MIPAELGLHGKQGYSDCSVGFMRGRTLSDAVIILMKLKYNHTAD